MSRDGFSTPEPPVRRKRPLPGWLIPMFILDAFVVAGVLYWVYGTGDANNAGPESTDTVEEVRGAPIGGVGDDADSAIGLVNDEAAADSDTSSGSGFTSWDNATALDDDDGWEDFDEDDEAAATRSLGDASLPSPSLAGLDREAILAALFDPQQQLPRPKITRDEFKSYTPASFQDIGNWKYERSWGGGSLAGGSAAAKVPPHVLKWDGKKIGILGYMQPLDLDDDNRVKSFMLMRNQAACCYGAPITLADWIEVTAPEGQAFDSMLHKPITVFGELSVGEKLVDGFAVSVFRMTPDSVLPPGEKP